VALYIIIIGAILFPALKGEAGRLHSPNKRSAANSQRQLEVFADFFFRCALPIGRDRIMGSIVLALHNDNERKGEAQTTIRSASPIVIEIVYSFCCTDRKWKYVKYKPTANQHLKKMPRATVPGQYPTICAILDPPWFHWTLPLK
jgi:hypothetical protein